MDLSGEAYLLRFVVLVLLGASITATRMSEATATRMSEAAISFRVMFSVP
jgi:hypothetical protein